MSGGSLTFIFAATSFTALVKQAGARVLVECSPALHALLRHTPGIDDLAADEAQREAADYYVPMLSLPLRFGTTLETVPAPIPYVHADPNRVTHWRRELTREPGF